MLSLDTNTIAVVVASGLGTRFGSDCPKAYTMLGDKPIIRRSIDALLASKQISAVLPVINPKHRTLFSSIAGSAHSTRQLAPIDGGSTRAESVYAALTWLERNCPHLSRVLIHDAARPVVPQDMLTRILSASSSHNAVVPVLPIADAIKSCTAPLAQHNDSPLETDISFIDHAIDRNGLALAQTPQAYCFKELLESYKKYMNSGSEATAADDSEIYRASGREVITVRGDHRAHKLTFPADEPVLSAIINEHDIQQNQDTHGLNSGKPKAMTCVRTTTGFDVHRIAAGSGMTLGGYFIPCDYTLIGHSDADVVLHAITDAIYGLTASADIGEWFPPSQAQWKDRDSSHFLNHSIEMLTASGGKLTFVDVTIICQQPKIGPIRNEIRTCLAQRCGLALSKVSLKATTTETLGFTGRKEGIAALATTTATISDDIE